MTCGKQTELTFPREWEYRLFCEAGEKAGIAAAVKDLGEKSGKKFEIVLGMNSSGGKYAAVRVRTIVGSKIEAETLGKSFSVIPGIRFIM